MTGKIQAIFLTQDRPVGLSVPVTNKILFLRNTAVWQQFMKVIYNLYSIITWNDQNPTTYYATSLIISLSLCFQFKTIGSRSLICLLIMRQIIDDFVKPTWKTKSSEGKQA